VVAWGEDSFGQCMVPALPGGLGYGHIMAGAGRTFAMYGLAGVAVSLGSGCGGAGMPVLGCTAPRVGQSVVLTLTQATPNASGFVYGSGFPAASVPLGSGCVVEVDLASFSPFFPVTADASGAWSLGLVIPPDAAFVGVQVAMQAAVFNTSGPFGFDLSNAVWAIVGY
jgi:hypothetical protein